MVLLMSIFGSMESIWHDTTVEYGRAIGRAIGPYLVLAVTTLLVLDHIWHDTFGVYLAPVSSIFGRVYLAVWSIFDTTL